MTDKYDEMAAIAGKAGGLDEKQWPGLAIILRGVRAEAIEQAAKVAHSYAQNAREHEATPQAIAFDMLAADIRSLKDTQ